MEPPRSDDDVPAFWRGLGLPGLVDVHVHFMPPNVQDKVWAFFDALEFDDGSRWPIRYRMDQAGRVDLLRRLGVVGFPSLVYPHKPGMAEWLNAWAADFAAAVPECAHSATFYPEQSADRYVAQALESGARIFKMHLQVGAYDPRERLLRLVWRRLEEARVPVICHVGSGPNPGRFTGPGPFGEVLDAVPDLVAVIAHMGVTEYAGFWELALRFPNVHLDTTMAFTRFMERFGGPYPPGLRPLLAEHPERVVFGSDFPTIPYAYAHQLEALAELDLGDEWLRAVCYDNGARLLGLPARGSVGEGSGLSPPAPPAPRAGRSPGSGS